MLSVAALPHAAFQSADPAKKIINNSGSKAEKGWEAVECFFLLRMPSWF